MPSVCLSWWSAGQLSTEQINYSALDVIKSLKGYFKLNDMLDLTVHLTLDDTTPGKVVDIVPSMVVFICWLHVLPLHAY